MTFSSALPCLLCLLVVLCAMPLSVGSEEEFNWPGVEDRGLILDAIRQADPYNSSAPGLRDHSNAHKRIGFHWAITSCHARQQWARMLTNTLLSAWASDVHPSTITIVWCQPYEGEDKEPSLFANLRLSNNIKIMYMPPSMVPETLRLRIRVTYQMALNVPQYYGAPELPLLVTEDDIVFAPDFNARLARAVALTRQPESAAYLLALYKGGNIIPANQTFERMKGRPRNSPEWQNAGVNAVYVTESSWEWGTQGMLFSPALVPGLRGWFSEIVQHKHDNTFNPGVLQDNLITEFNMRQGRVRVFCAFPSLVDHIGSQSTIFGAHAENARFHHASNFPFKPAFPSSDPDGTW